VASCLRGGPASPASALATGPAGLNDLFRDYDVPGVPPGLATGQRLNVPRLYLSQQISVHESLVPCLARASKWLPGPASAAGRPHSKSESANQVICAISKSESANQVTSTVDLRRME
jgi:hypothetical protein